MGLGVHPAHPTATDQAEAEERRAEAERGQHVRPGPGEGLTGVDRGRTGDRRRRPTGQRRWHGAVVTVAWSVTTTMTSGEPSAMVTGMSATAS